MSEGFEPSGVFSICLANRRLKPLDQLAKIQKWVRGRESNPLPSGYEPEKLPLLHPAIYLVAAAGIEPAPLRI